MAFLRRYTIGTLFLVSACSIYNDNLIDQGYDDDNSVATGGKGTGGSTKTGGSMGDGDTGGRSSGGTGGGATGGASGGTPSGGMGGAGDGDGDGDGDTGGKMGDGDGDTGGVPGDGDGDGDGDGTGGTVVVVDALIEDMDHEGSASYFNDPFYGTWDRYGQVDAGECSAAAWAESEVAEMFQAEEEDNGVLHVQASQLDCWGVGVYFTLRQSGLDPAIAVDLSTIDGIAFRARADGTERTLRIALEDTYSHAETCDEGCDEHARSLQPITLSSSWKDFQIPLSSFMRTTALDPEAVYAIHFSMDPTQLEVVDFMIDDVYTY